MGLNAPCLNCERKGCGSYHSKCEKYLEFKTKVDKANAKRDSLYSFEKGYKSDKKLRLDKITKGKR